MLSPVPHLGGKIDWKTEAKPYRDKIINYLETHYLPGLSKHIVSEHQIDPLHFEGTLNSYLGSAFSVEPTLLQSAYLRPHNLSEDVENLYFVGAGTHPGATSGRAFERQDCRQSDRQSRLTFNIYHLSLNFIEICSLDRIGQMNNVKC